MRRLLILCATIAFVAPTPALAASLTATVPSGMKAKVTDHAAFDGACAPRRVVVKLTVPPANGSVTTALEPVVMPAVTRLGGPQRCAGKIAPTAVVYYQSKPNFKGVDQFKYQRTNLDNSNDRLNGEITLTVTVK